VQPSKAALGCFSQRPISPGAMTLESPSSSRPSPPRPFPAWRTAPRPRFTWPPNAGKTRSGG
jgi:hypothetical protein